MPVEPQPLRVDFAEIERAEAGARAALEAIHERIRQAPGLRVEVRSTRLHPALLELLARCGAAGAEQLVVRLIGPRCLNPIGLRRLAGLPSTTHVELHLAELPPLELLHRGLAALARLPLGFAVRYRLEAAGSPPLRSLVALAGAVVRASDGPLVLVVGVGAPVGALARATARAPRLFRVRSEAGTPVCLFGGGNALALAGGVFGAACEGCPSRSDCSGLSPAYAERFGVAELSPPAPEGAVIEVVPELEWAAQARLLLTDRPAARLRLPEVLPRLPARACTLPWRRLEINSDGAYGPCCPDFLQTRRVVDGDPPDCAQLWNSEQLRSVRRAMARGDTASTCRRSCPFLSGGVHRPATWVLRGGPAAAVEGQIGLVRSMLAGQDELTDGPLELCIATTSQCNYDCVMCAVDKGGQHAELPDRFYVGLAPLLDALLLLDAGGGEPLASGSFRRFLEQTDFSTRPQLNVHLTTNGSYLTPSRLARYRQVPFSSLTISLNAAAEETYLQVNRGLPWPRLRTNLDALRSARDADDIRWGLRYSMVILRSNVGEIVAFAALAAADEAGARYLLPTRNLENQSIMTDPALMTLALSGLREVRESLRRRGKPDDQRELQGVIGVLEQRLADGLFEPL